MKARDQSKGDEGPEAESRGLETAEELLKATAAQMRVEFEALGVLGKVYFDEKQPGREVVFSAASEVLYPGWSMSVALQHIVVGLAVMEQRITPPVDPPGSVVANALRGAASVPRP